MELLALIVLTLIAILMFALLVGVYWRLGDANAYLRELVVASRHAKTQRP
jgi:hypothetical protein